MIWISKNNTSTSLGEPVIGGLLTRHIRNSCDSCKDEITNIPFAGGVSTDVVDPIRFHPRLEVADSIMRL